MSDNTTELEPITALLPSDQARWLREYAAKDERSLAWVMRRAVSDFIARNDDRTAKGAA